MTTSDDSVAVKDVVQVGASAETRDTLTQLQEEGHISDLLDGYRLGIATAISFGRKPLGGPRSDRKNMFSVASVDPDLSLKSAITEIYPETRGSAYRAAEDLAEQGVAILRESRVGEDIWFTDLMERLSQANEGVVDDHAAEPESTGLTPPTEEP